MTDITSSSAPMPTSPASTETRSSHGVMMAILFVLVVLNLAGTAGTFYLLSTNTTSIRKETASLQLRMTALEGQWADVAQTATPSLASDTSSESVLGNHWYQYPFWDVPFEYPESFSAVQTVDGLVEGQRNIRITSKPGTLEQSSGAPIATGDLRFTSGYQMTIQKFPEEVFDSTQAMKYEATSNPLVKKHVPGECDGAGCATAEYTLTLPSTEAYLIVVRVTEDYPGGDAITERIIQSLGNTGSSHQLLYPEGTDRGDRPELIQEGTDRISESADQKITDIIRQDAARQ